MKKTKSVIKKDAEEKAAKSMQILAEFNQEIESLKDRIRYLDENRRPYLLYDSWIGTPQDRLKTRLSVLEFFRNAMDFTLMCKDDAFLVDGEGFEPSKA
jgi:hypothetical protein